MLSNRTPLERGATKYISLTVEIGGHRLKIPCQAPATATVSLLRSATEDRYQELFAVKPVVGSLTCNDALLGFSDPLIAVVKDGDIVQAKVDKWIPAPLLVVYRRQCQAKRVKVHPEVEKCLQSYDSQILKPPSLGLRACRISWREVELVLSSIPAEEQLRGLDLSDNLLGELGRHIRSLDVSLHNMSLTNLCSLALRGVGMFVSSMPDLTMLLAHLPALESLDLSYNNLGPQGSSDTMYYTVDLIEPVQSLTNILNSCHTLKELRLHACQIVFCPTNALELARTVASHPRLQQLVLSHNIFSIDALHTLGRGLGRAMQLRTLDLSEPDIKDCFIADSNTQSQNQVTDSQIQFGVVGELLGVSRGPEELVSCLASLKLAHYMLSLSDTESLQRALKVPGCKLQELDISFCALNSTSMLALLESVGQCLQLRALSIRGLPLSEAAARTLAELINNHISIESIDASSCRMGINGLQQLMHFVWRVNRLQRLRLGNNNAFDSADTSQQAEQELLKSITVLGPHLELLDLSACGWSQNIAAEVAQKWMTLPPPPCWAAAKRAARLGQRELLLLCEP